MFTIISKSANWISRYSTRRRGVATLNEPFSQLETVHQQTSPVVYQVSNQDLYWQNIPRWRNIGMGDFLNYKWQVCSGLILGKRKAYVEVEKFHKYTRSIVGFHALCSTVNDTSSDLSHRIPTSGCRPKRVH